MPNDVAIRRPRSPAVFVVTVALGATLATAGWACHEDKSTAGVAACSKSSACCSARGHASTSRAVAVHRSARAPRPARAARRTTARRPSTSATAGPASASAIASPTATPTTPGPTAGAVVAIDPVTGQLVNPTPEQMQAFGSAGAGARGDAATYAAPELVTLPEGGTMLVLDRRYSNYATVQITPTGRVIYGCTGDPARATAPPAPPAAPRHEEK